MVPAALSLADLEPNAVAGGSLRNANVVVLGAGRTGQAVAAFAVAHGAHVTLHDSAEANTLAAAVDQFSDGSVALAFGAAADLAPLLATADLVVHSPAVTLGFPTVTSHVAKPLAEYAERAIGPTSDLALKGPILISEP